MLHGAIDYNASADAGLPNAGWGATIVVPNHYFTYSFDMVRAVMDRSGGGMSTTGGDVWLAWSGNLVVNTHNPIITANVGRAPVCTGPNCCPMTAVGTSSGLLDAARFVRSEALLGDADGRDLVLAYQRHGEEIARLLAEHPSLRGDVEQIVRAAITHVGDPAKPESRLQLLSRVAHALTVVELHGSVELKKSARAAVLRFPAMLARVPRLDASRAAVALTRGAP